MNIDIKKFKWTKTPKQYNIADDKIEIITNPHTDLWQRTYYHFRNDNAPAFQMSTKEKYFSFVVKQNLIANTALINAALLCT